nr:class I SAM-dependent methyltransferase [Butyrivibrio sp.]
QRKNWSDFLDKKISEQFPDKNRNEIRILDMGAGPGFISIILAELGYKVTAADATENMLKEAQINAGELSDKINFVKTDAEEPFFTEESFEVVFCRNLTWNLPHPEKAYESWLRLLTGRGMILIFDANWYRYLYDEDKKKAYEEDRKAVADKGLDDYNIGDNFDVMEDIALLMPMSRRMRPQWDKEILTSLGASEIEITENAGELLYSEKEKINYSSTPLFMIKAVK